MRAIIGAKLLASKAAQPAAKPFEVNDSRLPGFVLRVQPSGVRSYYAQHGRGRRVLLGRVDQLTPDEAREKCAKVLGNVAHDRPPLHGLDGAEGITLGDFDFTARLSNSLVGPITDIQYTYATLPSYNLVALRFGLVGKQLSAYLFGDNLTDKRAALGINTTAFAWTTPSLVRVVTNQPRTIGVEVGYKF